MHNLIILGFQHKKTSHEESFPARDSSGSRCVRPVIFLPQQRLSVHLLNVVDDCLPALYLPSRFLTVTDVSAHSELALSRAVALLLTQTQHKSDTLKSNYFWTQQCIFSTHPLTCADKESAMWRLTVSQGRWVWITRIIFFFLSFDCAVLWYTGQRWKTEPRRPLCVN